MNNSIFALEAAFFPEDSRSALHTLERLKKRLPDFVLTGGVASAYYFWKHNIPFEPRKLSDLDVVITDPSELSSTATEDFLISHFHPKNRKGKFHIVLVDPKTHIRIDVFPFLTLAMKRVQTMNMSEKKFTFLSLEDIVCQLLSICVDILDNNIIDPKYVVTMLALFGVCDKKAIRNIWEEYKKGGQNLDKTYSAIVEKVKNHPELLQKIVYSQDLFNTCHECQPLPNMKLAANQQVFDILGYV